MKGDPKLVNTLNELLKGELTAISQYMVHAEMAEDWGYEKLSKSFKTRAVTEMHHAERLIERILFLDGKPIVNELSEFSIGETIPDMVNNDHGMELDTVKQYNEAIALAAECMDYATKEVLTKILMDEDKHVDELEDAQDEIAQMGLPQFLTDQKPDQ